MHIVICSGRRFNARVRWAPILGFALTACVDAARPPAPVRRVSAIVVEPPALTLHAGERAQLAAQVNDFENAPIGGADLAFSAEDPRIVLVTSSGLVTSTGRAGMTRVRVLSGQEVATVDVRVSPATASSISRAAGGPELTGIAGERLPAPLVWVVTDSFGNPVPGTRVGFVATHGVVEPSSTQTDEAGLARSSWTLGDRAGPQVLRASAEGPSNPVLELTAVAIPGPPARLSAATEAPTRWVAGAEPIRFSVWAEDARGNRAPNVPVLWNKAPGLGRWVVTTSTTGADGLASASYLPEKAGRGHDVTARLRGTSGAEVRFVLEVVAGPPAHIAVAPGTAPVIPRPKRREKVAATFSVTDTHGNPCAGVTLRLSTSCGAVSPLEATTNTRGLVQVSWSLAPPARGEREPCALAATGVEGGLPAAVLTAE